MDHSIQGESFVWHGSQQIPVSSLSWEARRALADWLTETYLNELDRGRAEVWREGEDATAHK